jgi:hypothetical protein
MSVPTNYLRISEATRRLESSMWGGVRQPLPVQQLRKIGLRHIGFEAWHRKAAKELHQAFLEGRLTVYARARLGRRFAGPVVVPTTVLEHLITSRGGLPDQAIRPSFKLMEALSGGRLLWAAIDAGTLFVDESEFARWHSAARRNGGWPSQKTKVMAAVGRPGVCTEELKNAIRAIANDGVWSAKNPVARLRTELLARDISAPSHDSLQRCVDALFEETGDPNLRRPRNRRSPKQPPLTQNSRRR